jgi:type IV secretory pathway VirB2 component (pilin)
MFSHPITLKEISMFATSRPRSVPGQTWRTTLLPNLAMMALLGSVIMLIPELACAKDLAEGAQKALEWIKTAVQTILVVSVMGSGVLAAFGRMSWSTVGQVLVGAIVAGMATEVVDALYGGG